MLQIKVLGSTAKLYSPFSSSLVARIKYLPASERAWNKDEKCWEFLAQHVDHVAQACLDTLGRLPEIVTESDYTGSGSRETRLEQVLYIGAAKQRPGGETSSYGYLPDGVWGIIFPKDVLRAWFEPGFAGRGDEPLTLYGILGVRQDVAGGDIKTAWRKMVRLYHPDVNRDDDAHEMTLRINEAYQVLSNPQKRRKYDAGLYLAEQHRELMTNNGYPIPDWKPPIRCGNILVEGQMVLQKFRVDRIVEWLPIVNQGGEEMVSSWPYGANAPVISWIPA